MTLLEEDNHHLSSTDDRRYGMERAKIRSYLWYFGASDVPSSPEEFLGTLVQTWEYTDLPFLLSVAGERQTQFRNQSTAV